MAENSGIRGACGIDGHRNFAVMIDWLTVKLNRTVRTWERKTLAERLQRVDFNVTARCCCLPHIPR